MFYHQLDLFTQIPFYGFVISVSVLTDSSSLAIYSRLYVTPPVYDLVSPTFALNQGMAKRLLQNPPVLPY